MKKEYKFAIVISFLVIILVNLPLIYFSLFPKENLVFLGRRVINSKDLYTYLSYIEQSKEGSWLLQNLYTTEPQKAVLVRPSYVIIGKIAHVFDLTSLVAYHSARIFLSIVFCAVLYVFVKKFFNKPTERLLAFLIVLTSSGWGAFLYRFFNSSDLWIPESNTFLSLAESPHFILSQILVICGILAFMQFLKNKKWQYFLYTLLCLFPIAFEHPFDLLVVVPTLFITAWWMKKKFPDKKIIALCVFCTVGLLYVILQEYLNPLFATEQIQGASFSPSPINYLIGFGFLVPFMLIGAEKALSSKNKSFRFVIVWTCTGLILLYAPVTFQRRLSEGIHIPIAILASLGIFSLYPLVKKKMKQLTNPILLFLLAILCSSSLHALFVDFVTIDKDTLGGYYYYVSKRDYDGLQWIHDNTSQNDVVLSNWFYGNLIPGIAGKKVFLGHTAQTISFSDKVAHTNSFLVDGDTQTSLQFLHQNAITYIFLGVNDSMLQYGFTPDQKEFLTKVYDKDGVLIYKVE